ncbi:MAG: M23 family metallopeptidase [Deltaproteobacteria bacterium]|nr:MAG: M23 family metallopeptidase [Deltaproteobacteria bacterium]TNF31821.1 MAG: M23 family metallopeptidase [Deltaproteobacteria bacterium]
MKRLIIASALLTSFSSMAQQEEVKAPIFYWDNQEHMVQVDEAKCHITKVATNRFRVSEYFGKGTNSSENLRNSQGRRTSFLPNSSLVKKVDSKHKLDEYESIEVVGINRLDNADPTDRWASKRLDRGFLYHKSLKPIDDYALRLDKNAPEVNLGDIRDNIDGTFMRVAVEDSYFQLNCPQFEEGRDYILFRVFDEKVQNKPIAYVGVYWDESAIFRSFQMFTKSEAHRFVHNIILEDRLESELEGRISFGAPIEDTDTQATNDNAIEADDNTIDSEADSDPVIVETPDNRTSEEKSFDYRVCISDNTLNIRNESLNAVAFKAKKGEKVKIFQGWGTNSQNRTINGVNYTFIKIEFPERESSQKVGWAAQRYIKTKEDCRYLRGSSNSGGSTGTIGGNITSLDDPACCEFPTVQKVTHRFDSGMRRFGAGRSGGNRLHAACDLYRYKDEPILAIAPGKVIRNMYYFYQGTYALEVRHSGGYVVRYGEITGKSPSGVSAGKSVSTGQQIGYMGKVNSNCCRPMLHFELYSGKQSGALSTGGNRYKRRSDLMDPTKYLLRWEDRNF